MLLFFLGGCADFFALRDAFEELTNPLVVQSWYVGVEPLPEGVDLGESTWASGSTARVLMADAENLSDLASAPVEDATVALVGPDGSVPLRDAGAGTWVADGTDGLGWVPGDDAALDIQRDGAHALSLTTPDAPEVRLPALFFADHPLTVDLTGQGYDNVLVTVVRLEDSVTVYDSTPTDIQALYRLTHSAGSLTATVPPAAFSRPGAYAIGVAGLENADPDDFEGVNLALSALTAGALQFELLTVSP